MKVVCLWKILFISTLTIKSYGNQQRIGINEPWIMQYFLYTNASLCVACPTNEQPRSLNEIQCRLSDLSNSQNIGTHREILPFELLQPKQIFSDSINDYNRKLITDILQIYSLLNITLILSFDCPVASWMSVSKSSWCPLPLSNDTASWFILKDNLSWSIGNFTYWLYQSSTSISNKLNISTSWVTHKLLIEPWNEFDNVHDINCKSCNNENNSPKRAADLRNGIKFVLNYYYLNFIKVLSPSICGCIQQLKWSIYLNEYYKNGGGGDPTFHIYVCNITSLKSYIQDIIVNIPENIANQSILGETGCALKTQFCTQNGYDIQQRTHYFNDVINDNYLKSNLQKILFWRTMRLSNQSAMQCEGTFGITYANDTDYDATGINMFMDVNGDGEDKDCQ